MKEYRTFKTTMGHKIRVKMSEEEREELELFHMVLVALPLVTSALMFFLWVKMG